MAAAATGILTGTVGLVAGGLTQVMLLMCSLLLVFFSAGIVALGFACEVIRTWITQLKTQGA